MPGTDHKTTVLCEDELCPHNADGKCACEAITIDSGKYCESCEE